MKATKLPSGMWSVNAYLGKDSNGKIIRKRFTGPDRKLVLQEAAEFAAEHRIVDNASATLRAAANQVLERPELSPASVRTYRVHLRYLEVHEDKLLDMPIYSITSADLQGMIDRMSKNYPPKTVRDESGFVASCYRTQRMRMPYVDLPAKSRTDYNIPDEKAVRRILDIAKEENTELWVCIALAAFGPMREGEIAALNFTYDEDVDLKHNRIHVSHDYVYGPDKKYILKEPKTPSSNRVIVMPGFVMDVIRKQGYVTHWNGKQIYKRYEHMLKKHGLPHYRFHDLRHYCASYLHAKGYPDAYIQARTGHASNEVLRDVYTHVLDDEQVIMTKKMMEDFDTFK